MFYSIKRENDDRNPQPVSKSLWGQSKGHHSENLQVTCFWINSPTPSSKKFTIEIKNSDKISYLRSKIQTNLMSLSNTEIQRIPTNPVKELDLVTSHGHLLDEADELKSIDYFDLQGGSNVKFYLLSKNCGLLSVFLSRFSKNFEPIRIDLNLSNDSLSTVANIISTIENIPLTHLLLANNGQIPNNYNGLDGLNQFEKIYFKNDDEVCEIVQLNVKTLAGKDYQIEMGISDLIHWVKRKIQEIDGIPVDQQSLCLNGKHLDDDYTLKDCGIINNGRILHLVLGYTGRGYHGWGDQYDNEKVHKAERTHSIAFRDISNEDLMARRKTFSPPIWRHVTSGLNLHGICGNSSCKAFGKNVICPMGDGIFNLKYDSYKVKCPLCCLTLESIKTCGFTGTYWKYLGRKSSREELLNSEWTKASSDDYSTFEVTLSPSSTGVLSNWDHLIIQTCHFWNFNKKYNFPHWLYCSICLTDNEKKGRIKVDPCGHMTHEKCLKLSGYDEIQIKCAPCNLCELEKLN